MPLQLRGLKNWLVWRLEQVADEPKPRKVPYYVGGTKRHGVQGGPADIARLTTCDKAIEFAGRAGFDGIGIATTHGCGLVILHFDHCIRDGVLDPRVLEVAAGTYLEFSPSCTGVHAIMLGDLPSTKDNQKSKKNADHTR